jgi:exosortase
MRMSREAVAAMATDRPLRNNTVLGASGLMALTLAIVYRSVLPSWLADLWNDPNYSHGLIVPAVSAWLTYERRDQLRKLLPHPASSALALVLGGLALLVLGRLAAELFLMRVSLLVLVTGLLAFICGYAYVRALALPLAFLLFMVPLPTIVLNAVTLPLQFVASEVAVTILHWLALPALREGNVIVLPNAALEVVEACSGLRSMVSLGAMSVIIAVLTLRRTLLRALLVASSVAIAVLTNGTRISGTGVLAYYYGPSVAEGFFHGFSGWMVFVCGLALLGLEATAMRRWDTR